MTELEQQAIGPSGADEGKADGEVIGEAHGDGEVGVTGDGSGGAEDAAVGIAETEVNEAGGVVGGADEGVEAVLFQGGIDALWPGEALGEGAMFFCLGEVVGRVAGLGLDEEFLVKMRHFLLTILFVIRDEFGQGGDGGTSGAEVGVEVLTELGEHGAPGGGPGLAMMREGDIIHEDGPGLTELFDIGLKEGADAAVAAGVAAKDAEAFALQPVGSEVKGVVFLDVVARRGGGGVALVGGGEDIQQQGGIPHGAGHGAGGVLPMGDGDDTGAADEAKGGLQPDDAAGAGGADDGAIRLGPDRGGAESGGDGDGGPAAGAAGGVGGVVRIQGQAAPGAPATGGVGGADVGPLAEVGFAQQGGPGIAQTFDHGGVQGGPGRAEQGQGPGGGLHGVGGFDVVLDQNGHTAQGSPALDGAGLGIELDDGAEAWPGLIQGGDAGQVMIEDGSSGEFARLQVIHQIGEGEGVPRGNGLLTPTA